MRKVRWAGGLGLGLASAMLGACGAMGDNSNPTLSILDAIISDNGAILKVLVVNPGDHDLTLASIEYELVFGPLPVASATYSGQHALPMDGSANFDLRIRFDQPPMDPGATEINLTGTMHFLDASSAGNMSMTAASFDASASTQ